MIKKFLMFLLVFCFLSSFAFANDIVTVSMEIDERTLQKDYKVGDGLLVYIKVANTNLDLGVLTGALEFDSAYLDIDSLDADSELTNYFFRGMVDNTLKTDHTNQVLFWMNAIKNNIKDSNVGIVYFKAIKDFKLSQSLFKFVGVKGSSYDLKDEYQVETIINIPTKEDDTTSDTTQSTSAETTNATISQPSTETTNTTTTQSPSTGSDSNSSASQSTSTGNKNDNSTTGSSKTNGGSSSGGGSSSKSNTTKNETTENTKAEEKAIWSKASNWANEELQSASDAGLIPETFAGMDFTKPIIRKEFAGIAVKMYEAISKKKAIPAPSDSFTDTTDEYVLKAYLLGITEGTSKERKLFSPNNEITREQMATMLLRALARAEIDTSIDLEKVSKFEDDNEIHDWGRQAIYFMSEKGIIKGISSTGNVFGVKNNATVEQALAISNRCFNYFKK